MNPLIPMFALTGNPKPKKIIAEIENFKKAGIDCFMIYARSGLGIDYMSADWLKACEICIKAAAKFQMKLYIYDDYNWPSGSCKHAVEKVKPDFIAKRFVYKNGELSVKQIEPDESGMVFEPFITDILNPDAVYCFINLTHEVYYKKFKKYFGSTVAGFYTDEPSFVYTATQSNTFPYYDGVEDDYLNACNRNLKADMLSFFEGQTLETFPCVFHELLGKRYASVFCEKVGNWCENHGVNLTGHVMCDDLPSANVTTTGNWFEALKNFSVPGIDNITSETNAFYEIPYSCIEALRRNGKKSAMNELFALGPDSMTYARKANIMWHNAAFGINRFFIGVSHLDARGNFEKNSYFHHFGYANPNFGGVRLLAKEAMKAAEFAEKTPKVKVNLRHPLKNVLTAFNTRNQNCIDDNLLALIKLLDSKQICWQMLTDTECADSTIPTICTLVDGFTFEGKSELLNLYELENLLKGMVSPEVTVTFENGELAQGVFVREYTDGSVLIIDTASSQKRKLTIRRNDEILTTFTLFTDGVYVFKYSAESEKNFAKFYPKNFEFKRQKGNFLRCKFNSDDEFSFNCEEEISVKIYKRKFEADNLELILDGKPIFCKKRATELTHCFNPLYNSSVTVKLSKGEHHIKRLGGKDCAYLPLAIISGDFECENNSLSVKSKKENCRFFGKLKVTFDLTTQISAKKVCITDENALFTECFVNGEKIGEAIFSPCNFEIPEKYFKKTAKVTLVYYSSTAPLFGDCADLIAIDWCKNFKTVPETVDVRKIKIITE